MTEPDVIDDPQGYFRDHMTEKDFEKAVVKLAARLNYRVHHVHDSRKVAWESDAGFPDWVFARHDQTIFAELKKQKGKLEPGQAIWLEVLQLSGEKAYCWRPSDFDAIVDILSANEI